MKSGDDDRVHLVTSAQQPHSQEMSGRAQRYLISMAIRTVCLVLAIFVASGVLRWIFVGLAVLLPYVAVILANAAPARDNEQPEFVTFTHPAIDGPAGDHRPYTEIPCTEMTKANGSPDAIVGINRPFRQ